MRQARREWFLDHLLDFTVSFFLVVMLAFLVADIVRDDAAGVGGVLVTLAALVAMWAIVRASANRLSRYTIASTRSRGTRPPAPLSLRRKP